MKKFFSKMAPFILFMFGFCPTWLMPNENELSSHLRNDGKADGPVSYPGGLLIGLSGMKEDAGDESAAAIKAASKELMEEFNKVQNALRDEFKGQIDALTKEKIDRIHTGLDEIRGKLKENNEKLERLDRETAQKIASAQAVAASGFTGTKEAQEAVRRLEGQLMERWMRGHGIDAGVKGELDKAYTAAFSRNPRLLEGKKATQFLIADNTFVLPAEISSEIDRVVSKESGIIGAVNTVITTTKDYRKLINRRGTGLGDAGESTTRALQNVPTMSEVQLSYGELYSRYQVSSHSLDDSGFDVETEFLESTGIDMAESIDTDIFTGSGVNTVKGFNAYPLSNTLTWGSIKRIQSAGAVDYDFLLDVIHGLRRNYRRNAAWGAGNDFIRQARGVKDPNNNYVFQPSFNEGKFEEQLMGYPLYETEDLDPTSVDGARLAYFADFRRAYLLHLLRDLRMVRDAVTVKGFVEFYVWRRWGGGLADSNAIICAQQTASAS